MALIQLLLEQFEAGPGAGQKQPEALEAETLGLKVSFAHEAPEEEGLVEKGARAQTQAGTSVPPPAGQGKIESGTPAQSSQAEHRAQSWAGERRDSPTLHLLVRWNEAQELVHVAHKQPVGVEFHGGLHLLGGEEVLQRLVHLLAVGAAHTGVKACYGRGRGGETEVSNRTGVLLQERQSRAWDAFIISTDI